MPQVQTVPFINIAITPNIIIFIITIVMLMAPATSPQVQQHDCPECQAALEQLRLDCYCSRNWKILAAVISLTMIYTITACCCTCASTSGSSFGLPRLQWHDTWDPHRSLPRLRVCDWRTSSDCSVRCMSRKFTAHRHMVALAAPNKQRTVNKHSSYSPQRDVFTSSLPRVLRLYQHAQIYQSPDSLTAASHLAPCISLQARPPPNDLSSDLP